MSQPLYRPEIFENAKLKADNEGMGKRLDFLGSFTIPELRALLSWETKLRVKFQDHATELAEKGKRKSRRMHSEKLRLKAEIEENNNLIASQKVEIAKNNNLIDYQRAEINSKNEIIALQKYEIEKLSDYTEVLNRRNSALKSKIVCNEETLRRLMFLSGTLATMLVGLGIAYFAG